MITAIFRFLLFPCDWILKFSRYPRRYSLLLNPTVGIGDAVWLVPIMKALVRQRDGSFIFMGYKGSYVEQILRGEELLLECIELKKSKGVSGFIRLVIRLRRLGVYEYWLCHGSSFHAFAAFCAGIPRRYAFGKGCQTIFCDPKMFIPKTRLEQFSMNEKIRLFAKTAGLRLAPYEHCLPSSPTALRTISKIISLPKPWIILGISGSSSLKRWDINNYCLLMKELHSKYKASFLAFGGEDEREALTRLYAYANQRDIPMYSGCCIPLDQVGAAIKKASLFVGNDTGITNIAAIASIPTVMLIVDFGLVCYSNYLFQVHPDDLTEEMQGISVEQVLKRTQEALGAYGTLSSKDDRASFC